MLRGSRGDGKVFQFCPNLLPLEIRVGKNVFYPCLEIGRKLGRRWLKRREQSVLKEFGYSGRRREALRPLRARGEDDLLAG